MVDISGFDYGNAGSGIDPELYKQIRNVGRLKARADAIGLPTDITEPRDSLFGAALNFIDKPKQIVMGLADSALLRGDLFDQGIGNVIDRSLTERTNAYDILRREGVTNPIVRGVAGFAGEMLLDPTNWISLGTKGVASVGGRAISGEGLDIINNARKGLLESFSGAGVDAAMSFMQSEGKLDESVKALSKFTELQKQIPKFTDPLVKDTLFKQASDLRSLFEGIFDPTDAEKIFAKPRIALEQNIPFLGHLTGEGKGFFGSKKVGIGFDIPDPVKETYAGLIDTAKSSLATVAQKLQDAESIPVVGIAAKATNKVKEGVGVAFETFNKIFNQKAVTGVDFHSAMIANQDAKAFAGDIAMRDAIEKFPEILDPAKADINKRAIIELDSLTHSTLQAINYDGKGEKLLSYINGKLNDRVVDASHLAEITGFETNFELNFKAMMANPTLQPEVKTLVQKIKEQFDQMYLAEKEAGVNVNYLEAYINHRFLNRKQLAEKAKGMGLSSGDFKKARDYTTLEDAFNRGGLVGSTDLATLYAQRKAASIRAIADKAFENRVILEHGIKADDAQRLWEAAKTGNVEAGQLLDKMGLPTPVDVTSPEVAQLIGQGQEIATQQAMNRKYYARFAAARIKKGTSSILDGTKISDEIAGLHPDEVDMIASEAAKFARSTKGALTRLGKTPLDVSVPEQFYGELGDAIVHNGERIFLPTRIKTAMEESLHRRDFVKEFFGQSKVGKAFLDFNDASTNFFKKWVTLPWPGYWAQNVFGDSMFRLMDGGIAAHDPSLYLETYNVLAGKAGIKLPSGAVLSPDTFKKLLTSNGMGMSAEDMISYVGDTGKLDLEKFMAKENSFTKNLGFTGSTGKWAGAKMELNALQDKMKGGFENFFRINHVVHHLKQGDSLGDAVRLANEALINYRDLSPVESSLFRRFYMFYGWISKSTKKTLNDFIFRPGNIQTQVHAARGIAESFSNPDAAPSYEDFEEKTLKSLTEAEQLSFPLGTQNGKKLIGRGFGLPMNTLLSQFSLQIPRSFSIDEIMGSVEDSTVRTIQKQFATANPILKATAEKITGKNLYFDKPLDSKFLRKLPSMDAIAQKFAGYEYTKLPAELIDDTSKALFKAVPDGKGNFIADPGRFWLYTTVVPALSRGIGTAKNFASADVPLGLGFTQALTGLRVEESSPERNIAYDQEKALRDALYKANEKERLKAQRD